MKNQRLKNRRKTPGFKLKQKKASLCYYCFRALLASDNTGMHYDNSATTDHFIPLSRGGSNRQYNRVVCCFACNMLKEDLMPNEFISKVNQIANTNRFIIDARLCKNITHQVRYIYRTYRLHMATNEPYYLTEEPNKFIQNGMLEKLRKKHIHNAKFSFVNNQYGQATKRGIHANDV